MIDFMAPPRKKKADLKTRRITLRLPDREAARLEELAKNNDRTLSAEVLRALRRYFQSESAGEACGGKP